MTKNINQVFRIYFHIEICLPNDKGRTDSYVEMVKFEHGESMMKEAIKLKQ